MNGIMKSTLDETTWEDFSVLLHQAKIDSEDNLIKMIELEEKTGNQNIKGS